MLHEIVSFSRLVFSEQFCYSEEVQPLSEPLPAGLGDPFAPTHWSVIIAAGESQASPCEREYSRLESRLQACWAFSWRLLLSCHFLVIDRGQPAVVGTLSAQELKTIRRAVRTSATEIPLHWLSNGEVSASWHFLKELYSYRISSVEVVDADTVLVFTRTNHDSSGMRRPDFFVRRVDGVWQAAATGPIL